MLINNHRNVGRFSAHEDVEELIGCRRGEHLGGPQGVIPGGGPRGIAVFAYTEMSGALLVIFFH